MLEGGLITFFETDADAPALPAHRVGDAQDHRRQRRRDLLRRAGRARSTATACAAAWTARCTSRSRSSATPRTATWRRARAACSTTRSSTSTPRAASSCASAAKPAPRNWLALEPGATRITTRHYYENERSAAADPTRNPALEIEVIGADAGAARAERRVGRARDPARGDVRAQPHARASRRWASASSRRSCRSCRTSSRSR